MKTSFSTHHSNSVPAIRTQGPDTKPPAGSLEKLMDSAVQVGRDMFELAVNAENLFLDFLGLPVNGAPEKAAPAEKKAAPAEAQETKEAAGQSIDKNAYMELVTELTKLVLELVRNDIEKPGYQPEKVQRAPRRGYQPRKVREAKPRRRFQPEKVRAKDSHQPERVREDRSWMSSLVTRIIMELADLLLVLLAALEKADDKGHEYNEKPIEKAPGDEEMFAHLCHDSSLYDMIAHEFTKAA